MRQPIFGASLSIKQCRDFGLSPIAVMKAAIKDLGLKRFRLMSYWNEHEKQPGQYNFALLDAQIALAEKHGCIVTLCLGVRQPRWPENHWPDWAQKLPTVERDQALITFIKTVVERYQSKKCIVSWQLENEALLKSFGKQGDFNRHRLRQEFSLVKSLDPRPVIMTTSTSWGIPFRKPIPDIVGFSYYNIVFNKGEYRRSIYQPWIFKLRGSLIRLLWRRRSFIHELQAEPWGPKAIWEMTDKEQFKSMNPEILVQNIQRGLKTKKLPIDFWGLEWWFWRKVTMNDPSLWEAGKAIIRQ